MKIIWSPLSIERLGEISDYIAEDNLSAANKFVDDVFSKVEVLKSNVEIGRVVPELGIVNVREIIFGNYRIIYRYDNKRVSVLTIRHFKQILPPDDVQHSK